MKSISRLTTKKEKGIIIFFLFISIVTFFSFGMYHLAKFETVDEHFWKDKRIKKYWRGIKRGITQNEWKKTYIDNKPGITVAIISGTGLFFEFNPEDHKIKDPVITKANEKGKSPLYVVYNTEITERINFYFRFPILFFNALFLIFLFWVIKKITHHKWLALIAILFISLSPTLIGISQIINPDALLWSFGSAALFSYFALLKNKKKNRKKRFLFVALVVFFTGLSLLSKYTANLLLVLYPMIFLSDLFIDFKKIKKDPGVKKYVSMRFGEFGWIVLGSVLVYALLLPASIQYPKYLLNATITSPTMENILFPFLALLGITLLGTLWKNAKIISKVFSFLNTHKQKVFRLAVFVTFFLFALAIVNPWIGQRIVPLETLKESAYTGGELGFPMFDGNNAVLRFIREMTAQTNALPFSLLPISLLIILALWIKILIKGIRHFQLPIFILSFLPFIYLLGALISDVFVNYRYAILLYPFLGLLSALGIYEFKNTIFKKILISLKFKQKKFIFYFIISSVILFFGFIALFSSKPFYFNYTNILLPKNAIATDAWGYGSYEAAEYLNSLPNAESLVIWSDKTIVCKFFKGKCISSYKIDLDKITPDYFVFSRRGSIRHSFSWKGKTKAKINAVDYYEKEPVWELHIGGRPENYVKVVKSEEPKKFFYEFSNPKIPEFPNNTCNIQDYGATAKEEGGGEELNTEAFKKAIDDCFDKGGGKVVVPLGTWLTGPIHLKDNINLHLEEGAKLLFSTDFESYLPVVFSRFEGIEVYRHSSMIYAKDCENIAITGQGVIDGQGENWRAEEFLGNEDKSAKKLYKMSLEEVPVSERVFDGKEKFDGENKNLLRPSLIQFVNAKNILLEDIKIINSPMWTVHPIYSKDITIRNIEIDTEGMNTDGIALDSSRRVLVEGVNLKTGDDAIVIKSGRDKDGWRVNLPSEDIIVRNCRVHQGHSGISFGSEMSGDIRNVLVENCEFKNAKRGIRIKSSLGRGGVVENILVRNVTSENISEAGLLITSRYGSSSMRPKTKEPPLLHNIHMHNLSISSKKDSIKIEGLEEQLLENIIIENVSVEAPKSFSIKYVDNLTLKNIKTNIKNKEYTIKINNSKEVDLEGFSCLEKPNNFVGLENTLEEEVDIKDSESCLEST